MMLKSTDSIFKCACAMSPVTDWKLYGESSSRTSLSRAASVLRARHRSCGRSRVCVKSSSLLVPAASAFSERYLGVPLQDDSRYQVCVHLLPSRSLKAFYGCSSAPTLTRSAARVGGRHALPPFSSGGRRHSFLFGSFSASMPDHMPGKPLICCSVKGCLSSSGLETLSYQRRWDFLRAPCQQPNTCDLFAAISAFLFQSASRISEILLQKYEYATLCKHRIQIQRKAKAFSPKHLRRLFGGLSHFCAAKHLNVHVPSEQF